MPSRVLGSGGTELSTEIPIARMMSIKDDTSTDGGSGGASWLASPKDPRNTFWVWRDACFHPSIQSTLMEPGAVLGARNTKPTLASDFPSLAVNEPEF